jgi:hypothetical protein
MNVVVIRQIASKIFDILVPAYRRQNESEGRYSRRGGLSRHATVVCQGVVCHSRRSVVLVSNVSERCVEPGGAIRRVLQASASGAPPGSVCETLAE